MKHSKSGRLLLGFACLAVGFGAGYFTGLYGSPLEPLLDELGLELPRRGAGTSVEAAPPSPLPAAHGTPEDEAREALALLGRHVAALHGRMDAVRARQKEKTIARGLLEGRGTAPDSPTLRRIDEDQVRLARDLDELEASLIEARELEASFQRVLQAVADVDGARVDPTLLVEARQRLDRIERMPFRAE